MIVSSFTIIEDWVRQLGQGQFESVNLVPSNSETHGYLLSPADARALRRASLVVGMSPALEPWLEAWGKANPENPTVFWLFPHHHGTAGHDCSADPHAWISPPEVEKMVRSLALAMSRTKPGFNPEASLHQYFKEIKRVDDTLHSLFKPLPAHRRTLISQHANLGHFAERYDLKVAATILKGSSAESADPSARHFSGLLALVRKERIRVIVTDAGQNSALAQRLTEDAGIAAPVSLSFEFLAPPGQPGDTWASMMLINGQRLHQAFTAP